MKLDINQLNYFIEDTIDSIALRSVNISEKSRAVFFTDQNVNIDFFGEYYCIISSLSKHKQLAKPNIKKRSSMDMTPYGHDSQVEILTSR